MSERSPWQGHSVPAFEVALVLIGDSFDDTPNFRSSGPKRQASVWPATHHKAQDRRRRGDQESGISINQASVWFVSVFYCSHDALHGRRSNRSMRSTSGRLLRLINLRDLVFLFVLHDRTFIMGRFHPSRGDMSRGFERNVSKLRISMYFSQRGSFDA